MRVLLVWGSRYGGTEGIAGLVADELSRRGIETTVRPASPGSRPNGYDAIIVGGGLYANRWHKDARRFVRANRAFLRLHPVWFFSSGPLDDSADKSAIPPTREVTTLMEQVGALGHATFGGRLAKDVKGFPAEAIAKERAGDWRNESVIRAWAGEIADTLPSARPGLPVEAPAGSLVRLLGYGVAGWALQAALMGGLMAIAPNDVAVAVHAIAAPLIFAALAYSYFRPTGARQPLTVALAFTAIVVALDAILVAGLILQSFEMFASIAGTWLPFVLIFLVTWAVGAITMMIPATKPPTSKDAGTA